MKIDLNEERMCERALVEQKRQEKPKLIEILPEQNALDQISDIEKQDLADKYDNLCLTHISISYLQN